MELAFPPNGAGPAPVKAQGAKASRPARKVEAQSASLQDACSEFESLFLNFMLKGMRDTVPQSGLISGGKAEALYTSLLDSQLAREIAHKRSIGLSTYFQEHLEKENRATDKPE